MPRKKQMKKPRKGTSAVLKRIEHAMLTIRMHPVAVKRDVKDKAKEDLKKIYEKGSDSLRQHILLVIRESISRVTELKTLYNVGYYKAKAPKAAPGAIRMKVYKDMFNFNTSFEGLAELILLLGELEGVEAAKLLTNLFTHFCSSEVEINRLLRNAVIEALGKSDSPYALRALLKFASYSDNEKILSRLTSALVDWDDKIESLRINAKEKEVLRKELREVLSREEVVSRQYG